MQRMVAIAPATAQDRYGAAAQALHWLTLIGLIGSFSLGLVMVDMAISPLKLKMYSWHKWLGVCLWLLVWVRLLWRWRRPPPALPAGMAGWERRLASLTHGLLYLLLLAIPLSGWTMSSAQGFSTVLFGRVPLPDLVPANEALGDTLEVVHWWLNKTLLATVVFHVCATCKHQFINRDGLLWRMLPRWLSPRTRPESVP